ncbi:nuclease S1 [Marchantia polymorpha subsp. ruderalis]|nr:hypothetical protein MARPO_0115s0069 [Marchantia polymorpha]PTQ31158.1 hypothetical protein MARPO_0115s0069 [Marchantia polymorpha]BBN07896.1 hypothetical protein Mp_4g07120 [Marchantia polymorpha subsp. ruderalis]BBN07897.1 hypothetical protein Mp_4g07120 [Marchantia polymorpha subsp. ruderalis]|eukprot:PTQ31157.1 hypothetical protein MARPO_0115s0069 [Marchantia polymorpha]
MDCRRVSALELLLVSGGVMLMLLLLLVHGPAPVAAWGADGHHMTCHIAEPLLTPTAAAAVKSLLPEYANGSLAPLCSWPDEIRWMWKWMWTSPLHYIDTPDFLCNYKYERDCHDELFHMDMCVAGAINNYSSQLLGYKAPSANFKTDAVPSEHEKNAYNLTEALLFLAHYVGDIHQPLHVGFTGDLGGNTIMVHWYTRKYNLHHIWDSEFIFRARDQFFGGDLTALTEAIYLNVTTNWLEDSLKWAQCPSNSYPCPDPYAEESISLACKYAYRNATPGSTLKDEYFLSRWPIVERRLAQGGVRLATLLNYLFSEDGTSQGLAI